ncbi:RNA-directed DNA polymerase from mobile element jockey-like [Rhizophagus irregularis DAOM 181602=DAOM 197198]|nr:RNA-directed DNA polymerase from mobile element jockey-like [Rhizophagus irregularis DAOM 181602=DAOM 197198]
MLMVCAPLAKFIYQNEHSQHNFKSYWAPSLSNSRPHDGVGLLLRHPLHKHVQKIDPWKGRLLKLDLFFHQTKISIISVYIPPYHSIHYKERDAIFAQLNLWLDKARSNNYHVIILGDFNADTNSHSHHLPQHHLKILRSLSSQYFTDHQSHISSISGPSSTFYHQNGFSRLDYIWSSPGFPAPGLFSHVESCPKLNDNQFTDHRVLFTAFDFSSYFAILAKARLKQKNYTIPIYSTTPLPAFVKFLRSQKALVSAYLSTQFHQHRVNSIEYYTALRDEHFSTSPGSFISSALSVEHRSIILDRVLVVINSKPALLTEPSDIKQAAIKHFQSVVTPPLVQHSSINEFPPRWQKAYTPISDIDSSLYTSVMSPILEEEWKNTIQSMPNNKASGPSKISYEMLKHLTGEAFNLSLVLANACLTHGNIPADWREALVYPIPKPHEFDAQLKNTRPITLLETVRKCVVKVVTIRLSKILADNQVLQGGNFAGLPGGSTDIPIKMLNAIIHQQRFDKSDDQELWIVSQDISKAFDSIDLNMLKLALVHLYILSLLIKFIINFFTRRNNKIITHYGNTSGYRVRIACDPFILKSSALLDYSPIEYEQHNLPVSHITFMDDSTLIASSKRGIEDRLSITAEFYTLNNTQANSAKYILLSSEQFSQTIVFDLFPSPLIPICSLTLKTLALFKSFRFLGVWFCLSASSHFVHDQCSSMVKDMAALLSPKKLLAQHVAYLYNVVLLLRLEFRLQTTLFAEFTINQLVSPMLSLIRQKAGFLDCDACPSTIDLELWSHTFSLRTHSLFNSLLFSSRLKITWSLLFRFLRKDLRLAIPLQSILPKELFISMKNIRNNFGTHFLAQLVTLIPNSHTVASILSIDISRNYLFNPQWAISFNRNTNSFFVGRVIITYPAPRNEALISHWIASTVDDLLSEFSACQGCASAIPQSSTSKTLLKRCPSEKCFSYVPLSNLIRYPTKPRTYIHADTRSVSLSALLGYAKSLLLFHLFAPVRSPPINHQVSRISDIQLPSSVSILYIDGSFLTLSSHSLPSMAYAWTAIDSDGFIFESHYNTISSLFPSALRSEIFALLHGLDSLPRNSKITVATDCAQLISLWFTYVDASFIPRMLKESNHLLWSLARTIISQKNLKVTLIKVPAHTDDSLNNYVDDLAKAAHTDSCLFFMSPVFLAPCILQFNSLPVDMNIRKFIGEIFDAKNLLTLALLPRFNLNSSISDIDWACTKHCFNNKQLQFSHRNGRTEFCAFRIKILLDMLPTLTTLQKRKPHIYDPSWPCLQCNSSPETLDHLWTCPYILPEFSPFNTLKHSYWTFVLYFSAN